MDIESEWREVRESYHFIFARMLFGAIQDWRTLYHNIFAHLMPNGWFEQVEIDWMPRCDDGSLPQNSALEKWANELLNAMRDAGRPIGVDTARTRAAMTAAGLVDFTEEIIRVPFNAWSKDPHEYQIGRWFLLGLCEGLQALSLAPLTRVKGWTYQQVQELVDSVSGEIRSLEHHAYCHL